MKFSTRSTYGLRAMVALALVYNPDEPAPLTKIAEKEGISEGYLEQVMTYLRKGGLVRSLRGSQGGYLLSRKPSQITAGEIIRCLEGPLSPTGCVKEDAPESCERAETCVTRIMWEKIRQSVADVIDNTTLEDFCKETKKIRLSQEANMYFI